MMKFKIKIFFMIGVVILSSYDFVQAKVHQSCQRWFLSNNISSNDPSCEVKCATSKVDFGSFTCPDSCDELCKPISCENPPHNQCLFYSQCIEDKKKCGEAGYAINYGQKYCLKFLENSNLSDPGQKWRDSTLVCLQKKLVQVYKEPEKYTCEQIKESGFNSHVGCYTQDEASFCNLPLIDFEEILVNILELKDIISWDGVKQGYKVLAIECKETFKQRLKNYRNENLITTTIKIDYKSNSINEIEELQKKIKIVEEIESAGK